MTGSDKGAIKSGLLADMNKGTVNMRTRCLAVLRRHILASFHFPVSSAFPPFHFFTTVPLLISFTLPIPASDSAYPRRLLHSTPPPSPSSFPPHPIHPFPSYFHTTH